MKTTKNSNIVRSLSDLNPDDMGIVGKASESEDVHDNPNDAPKKEEFKKEPKAKVNGLTKIDETDVNAIKRKIGALHRSIQILLNKGDLSMEDHNKLYARQIECEKYEALLETL